MPPNALRTRETKVASSRLAARTLLPLGCRCLRHGRVGEDRSGQGRAGQKDTVFL